MNKKTALLTCSVAALVYVGNVVPSSAVPFGSSNLGVEYLSNTATATDFSFGVTATEAERVIDGTGMKYRRIMGYLGYDLTRYWTAYGTLSDSKYRFGGSPYSEGDFEYGVGTAINLIDKEIFDPTLFEDRIRLNANVLFSINNADDAGPFATDYDWRELTAHLTLSIVNDIDGNKYFSPMSIAVFGGGVYSRVFGGDNLGSDTEFGYSAGLELYYTSSISIELAYEELDDISYSAGLHVRF